MSQTFFPDTVYCNFFLKPGHLSVPTIFFGTLQGPKPDINFDLRRFDEITPFCRGEPYIFNLKQINCSNKKGKGFPLV